MACWAIIHGKHVPEYDFMEVYFVRKDVILYCMWI